MLEFNPQKHEYKWNGKIVPCVSNIIAPLRDFSGIPPETLEIKRQWGKAVHQYTAMYDLGTLDPDRSKWDQRMIPIVEAWQRFVKQKILNGSKNTKIVEIKTINKPSEITGVQLAAYLRTAIESALDNQIKLNILQDRFEPVAIECPIYSRSLQYAGTVDRIYGNFANVSNITLIECCLLDDGTYKTREYNFDKYWNIFMCCLTIYNFKGKLK